LGEVNAPRKENLDGCNVRRETVAGKLETIQRTFKTLPDEEVGLRGYERLKLLRQAHANRIFDAGSLCR
jgi:hypothetical protein